MAPDGVARVVLVMRDGSRHVAPVVGNVWLATVDGATASPRAVLWLDADGRVVRRLR
jgi:hypothetical protein